ncbi:hypothetical protein ACC734_37635, partial [Rhizobium ruizarguesonis]
ASPAVCFFLGLCAADGNLRLKPLFHGWHSVNGYSRSLKPGAGGGFRPCEGPIDSRRDCRRISSRRAKITAPKKYVVGITDHMFGAPDLDIVAEHFCLEIRR